MTITTKNTQTPSGATSRTGFLPIPTRIKDLREAQGVPPLVVGATRTRSPSASRR